MKFIRITDFTLFIEKNATENTKQEIQSLVEKFTTKETSDHTYRYNLYKDHHKTHESLTSKEIKKILKETHDLDWSYNDLFLASLRFKTRSDFVRNKNLKKYNGLQVEKIKIQKKILTKC
jgi:hypothetical protein